MPAANKAKNVFDSGKTVSFHVKCVIVCQQSQKSSSLFKIVVQRDSRNKRYDFEADTAKLAGRRSYPLCTLSSFLWERANERCGGPPQVKSYTRYVRSRPLWSDPAPSISLDGANTSRNGFFSCQYLSSLHPSIIAKFCLYVCIIPHAHARTVAFLYN